MVSIDPQREIDVSDLKSTKIRTGTTVIAMALVSPTAHLAHFVARGCSIRGAQL